MADLSDLIATKYPSILTYIELLKDKCIEYQGKETSKEVKDTMSSRPPAGINGFHNNNLILIGGEENNRINIARYVSNQITLFLSYTIIKSTFIGVFPKDIQCKDRNTEQIQAAIDRPTELQIKMTDTQKRDDGSYVANIVSAIHILTLIDIHKDMKPFFVWLAQVLSRSYAVNYVNRLGLTISLVKAGEQLKNLPEVFLNMCKVYDLDKGKFIKPDEEGLNLYITKNRGYLSEQEAKNEECIKGQYLQKKHLEIITFLNNKVTKCRFSKNIQICL